MNSLKDLSIADDATWRRGEQDRQHPSHYGYLSQQGPQPCDHNGGARSDVYKPDQGHSGIHLSVFHPHESTPWDPRSIVVNVNVSVCKGKEAVNCDEVAERGPQRLAFDGAPNVLLCYIECALGK